MLIRVKYDLHSRNCEQSKFWNLQMFPFSKAGTKTLLATSCYTPAVLNRSVVITIANSKKVRCLFVANAICSLVTHPYSRVDSNYTDSHIQSLCLTKDMSFYV